MGNRDLNLQRNTKGNGKNWKNVPDVYRPNDFMGGYLPPQEIEMEKAVLGAIMLEKGAYDIVAEIVKTEVFYNDAHQKIYTAMGRLAEKFSPIDILTVVGELKTMGELENVGNAYYVTTLTNTVVSSANVEAHARIILQKYMSRELIRIAAIAMTESYKQEQDVFDLMDTVGAEFFNLSAGHLKRDFKPISAAYSKEIDELQVRTTQKLDVTGVHTGFRSLDVLTAGWQNTDFIIIAARPSVGKTAFALNLAKNAAYHPIKPVKAGVFSLEMSTGQVTQRIMSASCEVPLDAIRRGKLESWQLETLRNQWNEKLLNQNIFIDDTPGLSILELRSKARKMVNKHGVGFIIIDYLQLMTAGTDGKNGNREQEISKISRQIKSLAKELGIPIIALSQLSRDVEKRSGSMPMLSDLRESGAIEQDADMVMFLYRDDYQKNEKEVDDTVKGNTYLKIAKHRNGKLETLALKARLDVQIFEEPFFLEGASEKYTGNLIPLSEANAKFEQTDLPF
ncbi:replicative DNA helicase [Chitinophaga sp. LS1]|uniref:replicative DNA helicase n=1 Tax=Chitinophaga sp. LS1 TaxID=3051176 RepID=UPI002AABC074|nr:replicative DNA helicase [Chitinophaga sp. LS1]WPV66309.1 replicative DNA helicase [Chitinophaga sp. LS1]